MTNVYTASDSKTSLSNHRTAWRLFSRLRRHGLALPSLCLLVGVIVMALLSDTALFTILTGAEPRPLLAPYAVSVTNFTNMNAAMLTRTDEGDFYLLGTDALGRDIFSRLLHGTRISLSVSLLAAFVSFGIGMIYGMVSGYAHPRIDNVLMRMVDFLYGFPLFILVILVQVLLRSLSLREEIPMLLGVLLTLNERAGGLFFLFIAISLLSWLEIARLARAQTLTYKNHLFVEAARSIGAQPHRILLRHILPNILAPCLVATVLSIPGYIFIEASLSFIGVGVTPPTPSWGIMIAEAYPSMRTHPHALFAPAAVLSLTTLALTFIGDAINDLIDPV